MDHRSISLNDATLRRRLRTTRKAFVLDRPHAPSHMLDGFNMPRRPAESTARYSPTARIGTVATLKTVRHRPDLPRQDKSHVLKRHTIKTTTKKYRPKYRRSIVPVLLPAMAVLLFGAGLLVVFNSLRTDREVKAQVKSLATATDDGEGMTDGIPSEDDTSSDINGYNVPLDSPRFIRIEKLDVFARVRKLGVGPNNVLKAPANIFDTGWYEGSAKPGGNGTVVIDGHVSGPTKRGVFYGLGTLKAGDKITVERGDGKLFTYSVTDTKTYDNDKVDMKKVMVSAVPGKPGLNLMTCAGRFNVRTNQYEQRTVVFAVQDS